MPGYRAGAGGGMFGSHVYPSSRPQIDLGGALEGFASGASSLIRAAYMKKRLEAADRERQDAIAYQRSRDQLGDAWRRGQADTANQLARARLDAQNARAGIVPATTEDRLTTTTVPNGTAQIGQLNAPSTPIERAMGGGIPNLPGVQYTPSNDPTSREVAARINHPPAVPNLSPTQVPLVKQELGIKRLNVPAYYDASRDAAVQRRGAIADQTARTHADAYEAAGLSHEDAMAAAQNPALARSLLAPHNKKVYFDADGVPTVVDAQDPQFPAGFRARRLGTGTRGSSRDPNISAAAATEHAIVETSKETAAGNKAIPKLAPFSINPQADSASVIGARTPLLGRLGELAIRRDSLQHSYDQEAGAINSGRTASGAVDMSGPRAELERRRQQMEAIVANPNAPLAVKARAQDLYRQHVESLGLSPLTPATPATGARP